MASTVPSTRPSQRQRAEQARTTTTAVPKKRNLSPVASHAPVAAASPHLSPSEKRLALIKDSLSGNASFLPDFTLGSAETGAQFPSTSALGQAAGSTHPATVSPIGRLLVPRSPSLDVDDTIRTLLRNEEFLDAPRTPSPKRVRRSHSPDSPAGRVGSGLLTPPQTLKAPHRIYDSPKLEEPQTPSRPGRGKEGELYIPTRLSLDADLVCFLL
jgi:hypothetical protein